MPRRRSAEPRDQSPPPVGDVEDRALRPCSFRRCEPERRSGVMSSCFPMPALHCVFPPSAIVEFAANRRRWNQLGFAATMRSARAPRPPNRTRLRGVGRSRDPRYVGPANGRDRETAAAAGVLRFAPDRHRGTCCAFSAVLSPRQPLTIRQETACAS